MRKIDRVKINIPEGAFYVFPDISAYFGTSNGEFKINNADDLAMYLLTDAEVATVTGSAFGDDKCIRISYAASEANLIEALKRITISLNKLK